MLGSLLIVAAAAASIHSDRFGAWGAREELLATPAPYIQGRADDVHRPGFNGRLWISVPVIGGMSGPWPRGHGNPGPHAYGASWDHAAVVYARVGTQVIALDPWTALGSEGLGHLERARQAWLKERGYVGGVRTFVNDAVIWGDRQVAAAITPRATIEVPADAPRHRSRMQVNAAAARAVLADGQPVRISLPPNAPAALRERVLASGGWIGGAEDQDQQVAQRD